MTKAKQLIAVPLAIICALSLIPVVLFAQADNEVGDTNANDVTDVDNDTTSLDVSDSDRNGSRTTPNTSDQNNDSATNSSPGSSQNSVRQTPIPRPNNQENINFEEGRQNRSPLSLEERKAQMETKRQEVQANQAERKAALQEKAQERISNLAAGLSDRLNKAIVRIGQVIVRIESRTEKLKLQGFDTSEAERYLQTAKSDLENASIILNSIDTEVVTAITSNEPRTAWTEVRTQYQAVRDAIRSAHQNIKSAVTSLKAEVGKRADTQSNSEVSE